MPERLGRCDIELKRPGFRLQAGFDLPARGITGLFGASGSGKTTVLRCLAGLERHAGGRIEVGSATWQDSSAKIFVPPHHREVGYVFQHARLFPHLDVAGNIDYGLKRASQRPEPGREQVCELLGINRLVGRPTAQLSGGERQRVAIARALLRAPRLLLMDEPLAALDSDSRRQILPFLDRLHSELAIPILYVSHSVDEITHLCDHLIVMRDGVITAAGSVAALLSDPAIFGSDETGVFIDAMVESHDPSSQVTTLTFEGGTLRVPGDLVAANGRVRVRVLARDVSLSLQQPGSSSILNQLRATVNCVTDTGGPYVQIELIVGGKARLLANISRMSLHELALAEGRQVTAQIKGVAVKPFGQVRETL
ncbi:MAG: molybdenum ABC transporter ATP-binding protein [Gammaproteobacteria bacterium]|nr:molybdenum ABC transporter ATP-binding protein [Gammaproteobacteria bacterium]NNF61880.1 molybdenum ABC transporter ATP-binding protein [Gammaproteobacteria bacterium]NNM19652.1 molybdenum ABC transporter ATP-binding protein [Gammaproteobacteria bacterium]